MTTRSDEITMGNPNFVHGFSCHIFLAMLPLYWIVSKRMLYNIPIEQEIFLSQNDYAYISLNKLELLYHILLPFPSQNIFIDNVNHLILKVIFVSQAIKIQVFL